jgi:hypothetical protein
MRRADGKVVQRLPIDAGPEEITIESDHVHVEAYGHTYEIQLRPAR